MYDDHNPSSPSPVPASSSNGVPSIKPADVQAVPTTGRAPAVETEVKIADLIIDPKLQMRAKPHDGQYIEALAEVVPTGKLPPIEVFRDPCDARVWVADGHARVAAAKKAGRSTIRAWVHPGGRHEAFMFALGANATHGARRTRDDLHKAVRMALADSEMGIWSDGKIAQACQCSDHFVGNVRKKLAGPSGSGKGAHRKGRDGKIYPAKPSRQHGKINPAKPPLRKAGPNGSTVSGGTSVSGLSLSGTQSLASTVTEELSAADILGGPGVRVATSTPHEDVVMTTVAARRGKPTETVAGEMSHAATPSSEGTPAAVLGPRKAVFVPRDTPPHFPKAAKPKRPFSLLLKILRETSSDVWAALDNGQLDEVPDEDFMREIFEGVRLCLGTLEECFPNESILDGGEPENDAVVRDQPSS